MDDREFLEQTNIVILANAARMAGLRFKNGELKKADIIERLMQWASIRNACIAAIKRANGDSSQNLPKRETPSFEDWMDGEKNIPEAKPVPPSTPSFSPPPVQNPQANIDFSVYALKREVHAWLDGYAPIGDVKHLEKRLSSLEDQRPVVFQLQGKSELAKTEGLQHPKLPLVLSVLASGENAFLKGPASSGKTTAAKQVREILAKLFEREDYCLHAIGAVSDAFALLGYKNATGEYQRTAFREAIEFGHLFLWDEIDASAADAVLVINSLDNGFIAFQDKSVPIHPHFRLMAGGNTDGSGATMEYSGRYRMDGAFRDRFAIIDWQIDPRIESHLSRGDEKWLNAVQAIRKLAKDRGILDVVATARATRRGPLFLANGMARMDVLETTCKRGALDECWPSVLNLPAVKTFLQG